MEAMRAARSIKAVAAAALAACALALCAALPGQAWADGTYVAKIGEIEYATFGEAMTAANATAGDVTVEIYGEVEFVNGMELKGGSFASIAFVGKAEGAKITINQTPGGDYLEAHGKTVSFTGLTLAKANPAWSGNAGHMGNYFSIQGGTVTYTDCTFPNGACTSGGTALYKNCVFKNSSEYGLWVYDDALVTVEGGTIDSVKGIKVYSEGEESVTSTLTAKGVTFTANVTKKPAVAIGYAVEVKLVGCTFNNATGVLELDSGSDADCEGVVFSATDTSGNDIAGTLTAKDRSNGDSACGFLATDNNGVSRLYTTIGKAEAEAKAGFEGIDLTDGSKWLAVDNGQGSFWYLKASTVTFVNGSDTSSVTVLTGELMAKPADPVRDGYTFGGWCTDEACTQAFDFESPVESDITLYAKWTENDSQSDGNNDSGENDESDATVPGNGGTTDKSKTDSKDSGKSEPKGNTLAQTGDASGMVMAGASIAIAAAGAIALIARRRAA